MLALALHFFKESNTVSLCVTRFVVQEDRLLSIELTHRFRVVEAQSEGLFQKCPGISKCSLSLIKFVPGMSTAL